MAERKLKPVPQPERDAAVTSAPRSVDRPSGVAREFDRRRMTRWALFGLLAGGAARRRLLVRHRGQDHVDRRCLCRCRQGRRFRPTLPALVQDVDVNDNQHVAAGQILYRLDPRQFQIALDNAKANLAQTALCHRRDEAGLQAHAERHRRATGAGRSRSDQLRSRAMLLRSRHRFTGRVRSGEVHARNDKSKLESLRQQAQVQFARLGGNAEIQITQHPQYLQAQAQVDEAQRQLDHTVVRAPFAGIVTNVPMRSRPANISPPRRLPSIWSTPITSGSTPIRRRPS